MKGKKITHETSSLFSIISVVVGLAIIGVISQGFWHTRFDLTEDKKFTLSGAALSTLKELPDLIIIKAVISNELPTQFVQIKTHIKDILEEFRARSGGKLELIFMDPGDDEEKLKQARSLGIQEVQMQEQSRQGLEIKKGFFGLAITYGDKKEVIPILNNLNTFEYDLIVLIKKLTGAVKTFGVVEGSESNRYTLNIPAEKVQTLTGFDENFKFLKENLSKLYTIEKVNLASTAPADKIEMLLVAAPKKLTDVEKFRLDQFLMEGRSVLFFTPGVDINLGYGIQGSKTNNGYEDLLSHYGISVKKNIVLEDRNFQFVPFGNSIFPIPYPYWISVGQNQLNRESAITAKLGQISFPWTSSLNIDTAKTDSGSSVITLASSTSGSWQETGRFNLFPKDLKEYLPVNQSSQPLVAMKTGFFKSYYETNSPPQDSGFSPPDTILKQSRDESRILVVGNAMFATDFYVNLMRANSNINFLLNAIDQLALDPDLIKIRSRTVTERPIPEEKRQGKWKYVIANMVVSPLILLVVGIFVGLRRRKRDALS